MRKVLFAAVLAAVTVTISSAQDLKDVQEKISKGKYAEAKDQLDKFMADPKNANNANAYYYKGQIQKYYAQTDSTGTLNYDASKEALDAYKKTLQIDPKNPLMIIDNNLGLFQLFDMHYNRGIKQYNNKNYDVAFSQFQKAIDVQDYIKSKGFSLQSYSPPALDTQLINLTASSAYLAKKQDESIPYFERLANAKIATPEFKEIYALIAQYYMKKNDDASANKYIDIGKQLYKDDDYWLSVEFGNVGNDHEAKLKRYEELLQKYPNNAPLALDYAIELFNHTYVWESKPADYTVRQAKLQTALDKAIALNPTSALANFIASQHYYTQVFDLEDARRAIVGNTPAAAAKRKEMNAQVDKKYDDMMAASQKAFDIFSAQTDMKPQDKTNYRKVTDQLIDYYTRKKMNDKVTFYQNKKAAIK
jgi:tetratricopeptide (TPR) repeat protein